MELKPFVAGESRPEEQYERMNYLSKKLGIPAINSHITLEATDGEGKITDRYHGRSRTYVRNFYNIFLMQISATNAPSATFGAGDLGIKMVDATVIGSVSFGDIIDYSVQMMLVNPRGYGGGGIVVGTGTGAESFESTALGSQIANGSSSSQLVYVDQTVLTPAYNSGTKTWTGGQQRIFNNNSGATITVAETGVTSTKLAGYPTGPILSSRDLLPSAIAVTNAGQLTVTYTFSLTFPA